MRIPGIKTAKHFSRWVRARIFGGALILGYHRVTEVIRDEDEVCVRPKHFAEHMEALSKRARPMHLRELVRCLKAGSVPPKSVVVTFDDGYADNLYKAKPVLEKYEIPATVFVCSGYQGREFWWDELDRLVMSSQAKLSAFRLEVGESPFVGDWPDVDPEADLESRKTFRRALYHLLLGFDVEEQNQAMDAIRNWARVSSTESLPARSMSHSELLRIADGELIDIGAHTRFHPMLPRLSLERQRAEIIAGKHELEEILGRKVNGFAYPHGRATHDSKRFVRGAGFVFACTSLNDVIRSTSDLHELPRFWPNDVDGEQFMRNLNLWM